MMIKIFLCSLCFGLMGSVAIAGEESFSSDDWAQMMLNQVNELRERGCRCGRRYMPPVAPLRLNQKLMRAAKVHAEDMHRTQSFSHIDSRGDGLSDRVNQTGYPWTALAENLGYNYKSISNAVEGWKSSRGHCENMMNPEFEELGIAVKGPYFVQVLGASLKQVEQLVTPDWADKKSWGTLAQDDEEVLDFSRWQQEMLSQVNALRAQGCRCGSRYMPPVPPLTLDMKLSQAAQVHARDMRRSGKFSHTGSNGDRLRDRVNDVGYAWSIIAENIGWNYRNTVEAVRAWRESPGHCENMMSKDFTQLGAALDGAYYVQVFATPR